MPGAFVRASGTFRNEDFDQSDYFKLIYSPEHHHWSRDFAVLFDEPIDGACGVEVTNLQRYEPEPTSPAAYTVDCDLNRLDTLVVQSQVVEAE